MSGGVRTEPWPVGTRVVYTGCDELISHSEPVGPLLGRVGTVSSVHEVGAELILHIDGAFRRCVLNAPLNAVRFDGDPETVLSAPYFLRPVENPDADEQFVDERQRRVTA